MVLARGHKLTSTMRVINGVNLLTHVWESTTGVRYPPIHFVYRSLIVRSVLKLRVQASASTPFSQKVISVVSVNMHLLSARLSKDHSCSTTVTSSSDTNVRELLVITSNMYCPCNIRISDVCCFIFLQCCNVMCVFAFATKIVHNTQLLAFTMRPYAMINRWP